MAVESLPSGVRQKKTRRLFVGVLLATAVLGLVAEVMLGFPISRGTASLREWLVGIVILGLLYGVGEFGSGWIDAQDGVTDPLWKRAFSLLALLTFWATLFWAVAALSTLLRGRPTVFL